MPWATAPDIGECREGRTLTCWPGIKDDIVAAGGNYLDKEVVIDGKLVTSRKPDDLPYFMMETIKLLIQ